MLISIGRWRRRRSRKGATATGVPSATDVCGACRKRIGSSAAYLKFELTFTAAPQKRRQLEASCDIGFHGDDLDGLDSANYSFGAILGGNLTLRFCSLTCLKKWFSRIVGQLERKIERQRRTGKLDESDEKAMDAWLEHAERTGLIRREQDEGKGQRPGARTR